MRRLVVLGLVLGICSPALGRGLVPASGAPVPRAIPVWAPVCADLAPGDVVRSARPVKEGAGSGRRHFWRGHWRVTKVLDGGRFLAEPLYRKDDSTGTVDRSRFDPAPGETARTPPGALLCEAFVSE